jgi:hypothetical protein
MPAYYLFDNVEVERCKRRELDHLLLFPPGRDRGSSG